MAFQHHQPGKNCWRLNGLRWMRPNLFPFLDIKAFEEASSSMTFLCTKQPQRRLTSHQMRIDSIYFSFHQLWKLPSPFLSQFVFLLTSGGFQCHRFSKEYKVRRIERCKVWFYSQEPDIEKGGATKDWNGFNGRPTPCVTCLHIPPSQER